MSVGGERLQLQVCTMYDSSHPIRTIPWFQGELQNNTLVPLGHDFTDSGRHQVVALVTTNDYTARAM